MNLIVAVDSNWAIGKEITGEYSAGYEVFQRDNERESCSDGKKDTGKLSGRTAA